MSNQQLALFFAIGTSAIGAAAYGQTIITPTSAISFQNEGTLTFDDTARLITQDGVYGPTTTGTVTQNAYATGSSSIWFDGISLSFDLSAAGVNFSQVTSASLEFYVRNGNSGGWGTHSYQVLQGAFNPTNQDANPTGVFFDLPNGGLLSASLDPTWFTSNTFTVTLRLWEVNVDMVRLVVAPTPGAAALIGLGAVAGVRRRRR